MCRLLFVNYLWIVCVVICEVSYDFFMLVDLVGCWFFGVVISFFFKGDYFDMVWIEYEEIIIERNMSRIML